MYGVFEITFSWIGQPLADWVDGFIADGITPWAEETLASLEVADWMQSLVLDGIIAGVGGVLTFVPSVSYTHLKPASLKLCTLLNKPERRKVEVKVDYIGFTVPDAFLVGFGLDYAEKYRNLPFIGILKEEIYA